MKRPNVNMLEGPLLPNILSYTIPIIFSSFIGIGFYTADLIVIGQFCGKLSYAAVSATGVVTNLLVTFFMRFSVGVSVTVAHAIGKNDETDIQKAVHTAIPTAVIVGFILTVAGLLLSMPILRMVNTPDTVISLSHTYLCIYFSGMIFNILYNYCAAILHAIGDTKSPLALLTISGAINVVLNVLFVTLLHLDVVGVGLATVISQAISAVLVLRALMRRTDFCKFSLRKMAISWPHLRKIIQLGLPMGIQSSLSAISTTVMQSSINSFGEIFIAGSAAAGTIDSYIHNCIGCFAQASVNFVGQNFGARNYSRVRKITLVCLGCVIAIGLPLGLLSNIFSSQLLSMFIKDSPEAIAYGMIRISIVCIPYFICGMVEVISGTLRGIGTSTLPTIVTLFGFCGLRVAWVYTVFQIPAYHTPECLFLCFPLSWVATLMIEVVMLIIIFERKKRQQETVQQFN